MALKPAHLQWSDDGTLRSVDYNDVYFLPQKSRPESYYVFLEKNRLPERFAALTLENFRIAELGFGSGLNFLLTAELWRKTAPETARLTYISFEKHPIRQEDLREIHRFWPELAADSAALLTQYPPMLEGFYHLDFGNIRLMLIFGDATDMLPEVTGNVDAWYLDGFSPAKNPDMWEQKLFPQIAARTNPGGTLSTFSAVGAVRKGLQAVGFQVKRTKGFGWKWHMTVATMPERETPATQPVKNIAVLGAGIAGASAAYALARRGYKVTVFDRQHEAAAETSGNPVGIVYPKFTVAPSPRGSFYQHGFYFMRQFASLLPSWDACGVVHMDTDDDEMARNETLGGPDYPDDVQTYAEMPLGKGLYQPAAGYLSPREFCHLLLNHPLITKKFSVTISSLDELKDFDAIIIAGNHNTKDFKETEWLPLQSLRGQVTYLKETPTSGVLDHVYCHEGFITPSIHGIHYAGATFQREELATPELRDEDHQENIDTLNKYLPQLGFSMADVAGGRTGYRTTTPDKLPMVGACPDYAAFVAKSPAYLPKMYISCGFGAHGMIGAPLAGEIIACQIAGELCPIPASLMEHLKPERFILRDMKRKKI